MVIVFSLKGENRMNTIYSRGSPLSKLIFAPNEFDSISIMIRPLTPISLSFLSRLPILGGRIF